MNPPAPLRTPAPAQLAVGVDEGARLVDLHPKTLRKMIVEGRCRASRVGRRILVRVEDLDRMLRESAIGGGA